MRLRPTFPGAMDEAYRTPLLDLFRRGDVPRDIRMLAANGVLAPRAPEQVALLVLLSRDSDPGVRLATEQTLARVPKEALEPLLARTDLPDEIRQFFAARGVTPADAPAAPSDDPLTDTPDPDEQDHTVRVGTAERLSGLSVVERIKIALRGAREERAVLIRDHNRIVAAGVLSNPKLTESEVETFARMPNVSEDVLRTIGSTRAWTKNYGVVFALTRNPKTPLALSLAFVQRLHERDVRAVTRDSNVPEPVRAAARRILVAATQAIRR